MIRALIIAWGLCLAPTAAAETLDARIAALERHWDILKPDGPGPFPVAVQLHGCGGKKPFQTTWAEIARAAGAAVIVVDSFAPRGIGTWQAYATVCTGLRLRGPERAGDALAALAWARRQSWADPKRFVLAGWSHGGWAALDAMTMAAGAETRRFTGLTGLPEEPLDGVAGAFIVYPYCGIGCLAARRPLRIAPRLTAIVAGADQVVGERNALAVFARAAEANAAVEVALFEDATHAFDEPEAKDIRVRYDPHLTEKSHALYRELIRAVAPANGTSP